MMASRSNEASVSEIVDLRPLNSERRNWLTPCRNFSKKRHSLLDAINA
jgi:hypothetical protein